MVIFSSDVYTMFTRPRNFCGLKKKHFIISIASIYNVKIVKIGLSLILSLFKNVKTKNRYTMFSIKLLVLILSFATTIISNPIEYQDSGVTGSEGNHGRVQIKVFRGPTEHDGDETYAPWGYWVKQPADVNQ
ncbi:uncharacterized protein LOC115877978 [Sitophilus oryzae]|uniref:Uncharacterized protein LOC115877978 n=1 Tax=Sitophilus oryzae TaxID=7048 RepID=A0A6J2XFR2_SITOR|nr:uncharacterized protein LOC115877978 [Sitophilus oryzae]